MAWTYLCMSKLYPYAESLKHNISNLISNREAMGGYGRLSALNTETATISL